MMIKITIEDRNGKQAALEIPTDMNLSLMEIFKPDEVLAHRRIGDYPGAGFPVVSLDSYIKCAVKFGYDPEKIWWITEENPTDHVMLRGDLGFLPDFIRMMRSKVLLRGNSTFSYWAGVLGDCKVYSPLIKGRNLAGGREQDVEFIEGNWPAPSDFDFVSDLHLKP